MTANLAPLFTFVRRVRCSILLASLCLAPASAQQPAAPTVPRLVTFSGTLSEVGHVPGSRMAGITFALYKEQQGGAPLWIETQSVQLDAKGQYTVQLGSTKADGLPVELFTSGEARWLGITPEDLAEGPRILLLSVPYALKAADAETIGGLPASAFVLAAPVADPIRVENATSSSIPGATLPPLAGSGTVHFLPLWTPDGNTLGNSVLFQSGSGTTAKIGINTTTPSTTLDVKGSELIRGTLGLAALGAATATGGKNSQPLNFTASSFKAGGAAVNQNFQWKAEPAGNNTANPSGTLNLLFGSGATAPAETGLRIASNGILTFAPGQTFPGGSGTVTSVGMTAPASDFTVTGSPITTSGTLGLNWTVAPTSANTANAIVKRDGGGNITVSGLNASAISAIQSTDVGLSTAITGFELGTSKETFGVFGYVSSVLGAGVFGRGTSFSAMSSKYAPTDATGVWGDTGEGAGTAVYATADNGFSLFGINSSINYPTLQLYNDDLAGPLFVTSNGGGGYCLMSAAGNLQCSGSINGSAKNFRLDHPLDPANKYLNHSSIESSEMLNLYTGNVVLGADGSARVMVPSWFAALNRDFRYQLTAIGGFAPLYIAEELKDNHFAIAGGRAGMKVSWQVTAVRHDPYAEAHPLVVEEAKPANEVGHYQHPELYGQPREKGISFARHPARERAFSAVDPARR